MIRSRLLPMGLLLGSAVLLPGCIVAVPLAAAGAIARGQIGGRGDDTRGAVERDPVPGRPIGGSIRTPQPAPEPRQLPQQSPTPFAPALVPDSVLRPAPIPQSPVVAGVPAGMQYLYGSGEAAALGVQAYQALRLYLEARATDRSAGSAVAAVVLAEGSTLKQPRFATCGTKPLAVVLDIDETAVLNLGYEADDAVRQRPYDEARWQRWERDGTGHVAAMPGAVAVIKAARKLGVQVVFNSNRSAANAAATAATLDSLGLGPATPGSTLWLREAGSGSGKDTRRWAIAAKYCVVALVGDQLGDFTDLFNAAGMSPAARRAVVGETMIAPLWGAGWFVLPNPVYGTGLRGTIDDVFPADKRWTDPADKDAN